MHYPDEFKEKCKKLYPDSPTLHSKLEQGATIVGRILDDGCCGSISVDTVLKANNLEDIKKQAAQIKKKQELYMEWCTLYDKEFPKKY